MFGMGQFAQGFRDEGDRIRQRRQEVSELFDEYRKRNPNATADEMWRYVENLVGDSEMYLRGSLPTRAAMERMEQDAQRERKMQEARERLDQANVTLDMQDKFRRQLRERMIWEENPERAVNATLRELGFDKDPDMRETAYGWIGDPRAFQEQARSEYRLGQRGKYLDLIGEYKANRMPVPDTEWDRLYAGQPQWVIDDAKRKYEIELSGQAAQDQKRLNEARSAIVGNTGYIKILAEEPGSPAAKSIEEQVRNEVSRYTPQDEVEAAVQSVMAELQERADTYKLQQALTKQEDATTKLQERYVTQAQSHAGRAKEYGQFGVSALGIRDADEAEVISGATETLLSSLFADYIALPGSTSEISETDLPYHIGALAAEAVRASAQANKGMPNLADARQRLMATLQADKSVDITPHRNAADLAKRRAQTAYPKPQYAEDFAADKIKDIQDLSTIQDEALERIDTQLQGLEGPVLANNLQRKQASLSGMINRLEREIADIEHIRQSPNARAGSAWTEKTGDRAIAAARERIAHLNAEMERIEERMSTIPQDTSGYGAHDVRRGSGAGRSAPPQAPRSRSGPLPPGVEHNPLPGMIREGLEMEPTEGTRRSRRQSSAGSPEDFVAQLAPAARAISAQTGIPAEIIIAQAALETGWGKSVAGNNLFGIKAGRSWQGPTQSVGTHEYINGQRQNIRDDFRAYGSVGESMLDHARLLTQNPRYAGVLQAKDPAAAARALQEAGYATDPEYANKLISIMRRIGAVS